MQPPTIAARRHIPLLLAILSLLAAIAVPVALAAHGGPLVEPVEHTGNPTCSDLVDSDNELRIDESEISVNGPTTTHTGANGFTVEVTAYTTADGQEFDFVITSNHSAQGVFSKGGPTGNLYDYRDIQPVQADNHLHSPRGPSGKWYGLSHISFCYDDLVFVNAVLSGTKFLGDTTTTIGGWDVFILDESQALIDTVTTDSNGEWTYTTEDFLQGTEVTLYVCEEQPDGWQQTGPASGSAGTIDIAGFGTCHVVTFTAGTSQELIPGLDFRNVAELEIAKTAATSLTRTWTWDIDKVGDQTEVEASTGDDPITVNYDVTVSATSEDSDHTVFGNIVITNPTEFTATIDDVSDDLGYSDTGADIAAVDCGGPLPQQLGPGETLTCSYSHTDDANLTSSSSGTNTATVEASGGFLGGTATDGWDFADATVDEVDRCIDVVDDKKGDLGEVCAPADGSAFSQTLEYSLDIDPADYEECSENTFDNTATFTTNDTSTTGSDDHSVTVSLLCGAIEIVKTAKHADDGGATSPDLVATFTITGPDESTRTVTTDENGEACVDDLPFGTYSVEETGVPNGYAAPDIGDVTVDSESDCGDGNEVTVDVENTPLTDITWSVDSQHDGATMTVVTCYDGVGNTLDGYPMTVGDGSDTLSNLLPTDPEVTITCDFVVDP